MSGPVDARVRPPLDTAETFAPDWHTAAADHVAWLRLRDLVPGREIHRYQAQGLWKLIAYSYPRAQGAARLLLIDILGWFTVLDDHFDGPPGRDPEQARALVDLLVNAPADSPADPRTAAILAAWQDIRRRQCLGMSDAWARRTAAEWARCLDTFVTEARHRADGTLPTPDDAVPLRRHASCLYPFMNMLERVRGAELPDRLRADPAFDRLRAHTADAATLINDVFSLSREEERDSPFNMVVILQRHQGADRPAALAAVRAWIEGLRRESDALRESLSREYPDQSWYLRQTARLVDGVHRWSSTTFRYHHAVTGHPN
ncbi:terpene synthase family protein [Actinokineospora iranica]|uniref:Uncharacterized protein n=1 Tax=Actinokineospora iranica TaxID=1271860 RepID=A0A1G6XQ44_9PSEU|nr:terpene synthase family protein [Actinokineospora iranica]SDD79487.1 hypothetical protein SAMN05216174_11835 [Actinokineospora iranica]